MKLPPEEVKLISRNYTSDTSTYRYKDHTFRVDQDDVEDLEKRGIVPDYVVLQGQTTQELSKLFVYGIFLDKSNRKHYGMSDPRYATVKGYITVGNHITRAIPVDLEGVVLTGLVVDVAHSAWEKIDRVEAGYDRVVVKTSNQGNAWMYVARMKK